MNEKILKDIKRLGVIVRETKLENKERTIQSIIKDYQMALKFQEYTNAGTLKKLRKKTGIGDSKYRMLRKLWQLFGDDKKKFEQSLKDWLDTKPAYVSLRYFIIFVQGNDVGVKYKPRHRNTTVMATITNPTTLAVLIQKANNGDPSARSVIAVLRKMLMHSTSFRKEIADQDYLSFSPCCCCGDYEEIPIGGFRLSEVKNEDGEIIKFPKCNSCIEKKAAVDWQLLAGMYFNYARNIEYVFDQIIESD